MRAPIIARLLLVALGLLLHPVPLRAEVVAINSEVFNRYARKQLSDGTFTPEYYSFGEGGCWSRAIKDPWMDKLQFMDIARVVAGPLAKMNFRAARTAAEAQLLIIIYWGSTQGSTDLKQSDLMDQTSAAVSAYDRTQEKDAAGRPSNKPVDTRTPEGRAYESMLWQIGVNNRMRDQLDDQNARILGYSEALDRARFAVQLSSNRDVVQELGGNRYYVVLQAFDFKTATKEKKLVPLWTTRLSVAEQGEFGAALNRMVSSGNRYFGRATDGLKRERTATVDLAPLKILEDVPSEDPAAKR